MTKLKWFLIACALLALSCNALQNTVTTPETIIDPSTGCPYPKPTDAEITQARKYMSNQFTADWNESYSVMDNRISVARKSSPLNAVINFDTVTFCNVTSAALDNYYTDRTFDIIFQNYDSHKFLINCKAGDLRVYELDLRDQGFDYNGRFWVEIIDAHHIREMLVVFPVADQNNLDLYSNKLVPSLPACH